MQDYPLSQSHTHAFSISLWNGKTIIMAHTYSHTYIDLLSTWAKKHFSLHGELCWRQTTWMVRSRFVQMTEALLATQKQDLHLPSLLWIYVRCFRNYCEHKALIKEKINKSIYNITRLLKSETWYGWMRVWWFTPFHLIKLLEWHKITCIFINFLLLMKTSERLLNE